MTANHIESIRREEVAPEAADEVVEVLLLLPVGQLAALEALARSRGLTTGELTRGLIEDFLHRPPGPSA